jgi:hypothetical protein
LLVGVVNRPAVGKLDPNTLIDVTGSIGGVKARESRAQVEHLLGLGKVVSTSSHHQKVGGDYTLTRVLYPSSRLVVLYVTSGKRSPQVFGVFTTSPRYHTATGLRVGSTLEQASHTPGIHCYAQNGYFACQGGLGYEKPITSFTVKDGRVVRVFVAAVATLTESRPSEWWGWPPC